MEQIRKKSYVARELRRRRIEKRYRTIEKVKECIAGAALIICTEIIMFALMLM